MAATNTPQEIRPFADFLMELRNGTLHDQLSMELSQLVQDVRAHGKKGSLTLRLDVDLYKGGDTIEVAATVTNKPPRPKPAAAIFYPDETGGLHRNDPHQPMLPLRDVDRPKLAGEGA